MPTHLPFGITLRLSIIAFVALLGATTGRAEARTVAELAPAGACGAATDGASRDAAVLCHVNWARRSHGLEPVVASELLARAAAEKAREIVRCAEFSHTPCGVASATAVNGVGYRYRIWGETLYSADGLRNTPRAAVRAWLQSPPHRAALLRPEFREAGSVQLSHRDPDFPGPAGVWVLELGRR